MLKKKLTKTERNYSTIHREALAIMWAVRKFRDYIYGRKFLLRTDHKPLTFIITSTKPKCSRWALELSDFQFDIEHVKCMENTVSDAVSRASIEDNEIDLPVLVVTRETIARLQIIERAHLLGHFGVQRTLELAKLVNDKITLAEVQDYVGQCKNVKYVFKDHTVFQKVQMELQ